MMQITLQYCLTRCIFVVMGKLLFIDNHPLYRGLQTQYLRKALPMYEIMDASESLGLQELLRNNKFQAIIYALHPNTRSPQDLLDLLPARIHLLILAPFAQNEARRLLQLRPGKLLASDANEESFLQWIRHTVDGESPIQNSNRKSSLEDLSKRELEVFVAIAQGHKPQKIASLLGVETSSIKTYRDRIKNKTLCKSDAEIVFLALKWGLISPN